MRTTVVLVQDAGTAAVNGRYTFSRLLKGINPYYTRRGVYRGQEVTFGIFKYDIRSSLPTYQWFLSAIPDSTQPGSPTDIDFYYALAPEGKTMNLLNFNYAAGYRLCTICANEFDYTYMWLFF